MAVNELDEKSCELKSLYLLKRYHGMGYGKCLIEKAIGYANDAAMRKCILTRCLKAKGQSDYTTDTDSLTQRGIIKMNGQMYLWCLF